VSRRIARESALQVMFQVDMAKVEHEQALEYIFAEFAVPESSQKFARFLITGTLARLQEIDQILQFASKEWNIDRMANVDRNIMRLAVFELFYCPDIPGNVTVNEAIELAKTYSGEESGKFVNGILGGLLARAGKSRDYKTEETLADEESMTAIGPVETTIQADIEPVSKGDLE